MDHFRGMVRERMEELASKGVYAKGYDRKSYEDLKRGEDTVRPDMIFCGAPHLLIPHAPAGKGCWRQDTDRACAYFELLCCAHGLGAIMMSYCLDVLDMMPDIRALLNIPDDHYGDGCRLRSS